MSCGNSILSASGLRPSAVHPIEFEFVVRNRRELGIVLALAALTALFLHFFRAVWNWSK